MLFIFIKFIHNHQCSYSYTNVYVAVHNKSANINVTVHIKSANINVIYHTPYGVTKFAGTTFPSVLKKLTAVSESLAHQKYYFCYREDKFKYQNKQNEKPTSTDKCHSSYK